MLSPSRKAVLTSYSPQSSFLARSGYMITWVMQKVNFLPPQKSSLVLIDSLGNMKQKLFFALHVVFIVIGLFQTVAGSYANIKSIADGEP